MIFSRYVLKIISLSIKELRVSVASDIWSIFSSAYFCLKYPILVPRLTTGELPHIYTVKMKKSGAEIER